MKTKKVYLAGRIQGLSFEESRAWRCEATRQFRTFGIAAISPLSLEDAVHRAMSGSDEVPDQDAEYAHVVEVSRYIVWKDLEIIKKCSAVLVNIADPSWGTGMEIFFASHVLNMPVVAFGKASEQNPWIRHHLIGNYQEMDAAIKFINEVFKFDYA